MPTIKETEDIISITPINQPILLVGIHGVGKSQCLSSYFEKQGYRVITKFLGQMADPGDLIGLPFIETKMVNGKEVKVTSFASPEWWPLDPEEKIVLFFDEINRSNPDVRQCIMDIVLNRKLNGKSLPKNCRIVAAMNPMDDEGTYDVDELDTALLDRFNVYDFKPSSQEWLFWGAKTKIHGDVLSYISKNPTDLDPKKDSTTGRKKGEPQASRRSWERVSDTMNQFPNTKLETLRNTCGGQVGIGVAGKFVTYITNKERDIPASTILLNYSKELENKIIDMDVWQIMQLNNNIALWLHENEKDYNIDNNKKIATTVSNNMIKYVNLIPDELMSSFFNIMHEARENHGQSWPRTLVKCNRTIGDKLFKTLSGNDEDEESWE